MKTKLEEIKKVKKYSCEVVLKWHSFQIEPSKKKARENIKNEFLKRFGIELRNCDIKITF